MSGVSDFKSWEAFEEQTSLIWRNAREYNEEGSDITLLAGELEVSLPSGDHLSGA